MIKVIRDINYIKKLNAFLELRREGENQDTILVKNILKDIKKNKLKALIKYEKKFGNNKNIKPSKKQINKAIKKLDPKVKKAIDFAYNRIFKFHSEQIKSLKNIYYKDKYKNILEYRNVPIDSVGIYVPGNLPSTLLMNSIPAKLAKVRRIVLATPKINSILNFAKRKNHDCNFP